MTTPIKYRITSTATKPVSDTVKGAPLTSLEIDGNFRSIKDSIELIQSAYLPAGYSAPVEYVAGVVLSSATQTVAYQGEVYAPKAAEVPFTTSGTFEVTKFVQIQPVASVDLAATDGASLVGYDGQTVQDVLDAVTGSNGAASVGYTPAGAGAVGTSVQSKLREHDASLANVEGNLNFNTLPTAVTPVDDNDLLLLRQGAGNTKLTVATVRVELAVDAINAATAAQASRVAAEAARDAAQLSAGVYATTAAGLAATTSGKYFSVPSADNAEYLILYLNNSGTAVEQKRYPAVAAITAAEVSYGNIISTSQSVPSVSAASGATKIIADGKELGFNIPAGSTGANSYVIAFIQPSAETIAALVGSTIRLYFEADVSANFTTDKTFSSLSANIVRTGGSTTINTPARREQIGNKLYVETLYTVTATDIRFGATLQIASSNTNTNAHSLQMKVVSFRVESWAGENKKNDFLFDQRTSRAIAVYDAGPSGTASVAAISSAIASGEVSYGNVLGGDQSINTVSVSGGATKITVGGKDVGFSIPAGSTGANSSIVAFIQPSSSAIAALVGSTIRLYFEADVSDRFLSDKTFSTLSANIVRTGGNSTVSTPARREQIGNKLYIETLYTVTATDIRFGATLQIAAGSTNTDAHSIQVKVVSFRVENWIGGNKKNDFLLDQRMLRSIYDYEAAGTSPLSVKVASGEISYGNVISSSDGLPNAAGGNGATKITVGGRDVGFTIPAGSTGASAYVIGFIQPPADVIAALVGSTIRLFFEADVTTNFTTDKTFSTLSANIIRSGGNATINTPARREQIGTKLYVETLYTVTATDIRFGASLAIASNNTNTNAHSIQMKVISFRVEAWVGDNKKNDFLINRLVNRGISEYDAGLVFSATEVSVPVSPGASLSAANTAIADASSRKRYSLKLSDGNHNVDNNWFLKNYVDLVGSDRDRVRVSYELPNNAAPSTISSTQTLWMNESGKLKNVTITAKNMRYPVHSDSSNVNKDRIQEIEDSWIEHLGNQGAQDYQNSIGSGVTVWTPTAWGCGTSSGMQIIARRSTFKSPVNAFYFHTNGYFDKPCYVKLENSDCIATGIGGRSIYVQPLGSLQRDILEVVGCKLVGNIGYYAWPWMPTDIDNQPADHCEIKIIGHGNTPAVFGISEPGRALKIESQTDGSSSTVAVSGTAVANIFGREVYSKPGCPGIKGYVYGWADISGVAVGANQNVFITSLGKRLGDCSVTSKTLSVAVNGNSPVVITFDKNYTNMTNAQILAEMNTALGASAIASEYNIGARYRPQFTDEERTLKNVSTDGILMGMALAYSGDTNSVRKMTSSDPSHLFAGIAWEDIYPQGFGRVKIRGHLPVGDLLGVSSGLTLGQQLYVDSGTAGRLTTTVGANPIMRAIRSDAVEVGK